MKFCHKLDEQRKLSPVEWGPFFLNYKLLKKKIKSMTSVEKYHKPSATTPEALSSSQSEVEFFRMMDYEIRRGTQFLALSEGQYVLKTRTVLDGYRSTQHLLQSPMLGLDAMLTTEAVAQMWIRLLRVCISVYTDILLLNHWVVVSYCGFSKILKKHDRRTGFMTKEKYLRYVVAQQHFTSYPKLHSMLRDMEALYVHILRRLPPCAERTEVEAKMDSAKRLVAATGLDFAKYTGELTRSISIQRDNHTYRCAASTPSTGQGHKRKEAAELLSGGTDAYTGTTAPPPPLLDSSVSSSSSISSSGGSGGGSGGNIIAAQASTLELREKETLLLSGKGKRRRVSVDTPLAPPETVDWFEEFSAEIGPHEEEEEEEEEGAGGDITTTTAGTSTTTITTSAAAAAITTSAAAATATVQSTVKEVAVSSGDLVESAVGRAGVVASGDGDGGVDGVPEVAGVMIVVAVQKRRDSLGSAHHAVLGSEADAIGVSPASGMGVAANGMGAAVVAASFEAATAASSLGKKEKE